MVHLSEQENNLEESSFGGLPVKQIGSRFDWPKCKSCDSDLQYQGKIKTDLGLELIFMCASNPGMCEEWDPDLGGNAVLIVEKEEDLEFVAPAVAEAIRNTEYGVKLVNVDSSDYDQAREEFGEKRREVLGQLFGSPSWIQGDETPICPQCGNSMRFVAQLEEGPDYQTAMNFGSGAAYVFDCHKDRLGKFLWQC